MTIRLFQHLQPPPSFGNLTDAQVYSRKLFDSLFRVMQGKTQNVYDLTLTINAASTTITDLRLSTQTAILFDPRSANAATELKNGTMYILDANRGKGTCTITHANNSQSDRTYFVAFVG